MYSEQGLLALIRPSAGQVCHSLIVVSNWTPGSAHAHAAKQICSQSALARMVFVTFLSVRRVSAHGSSRRMASMYELVRRTELLEFCPETVAYPSPSQSVS